MADPSIIQRLQKQILALQGMRQPAGDTPRNADLGKIESAFPNGVFPIGAVHEFISSSFENASCTSGFIAGILGKLMKHKGPCVWIGAGRRIYPPALITFGIEPERVLFVDTYKARDTLWAVEEALKCDALAAVVGELRELSFNDSRRLQLTVERSHVTGFIHRCMPKTENPVACVSRWKITPGVSEPPRGMPGLGFPRWHVALLKVRNGQPGNWLVEWTPQGLKYPGKSVVSVETTHTKKTA